MIKYQCDFCKIQADDKNIFSKLSITMSANYPKYNSVKGMFCAGDWDLCPICFERITKHIKLQMEPRPIPA